MAGAIKGITIEFDGNTTKLSKAIGDVNKESKSLQQELRGINTLLKMDPSSTELLSQKQKVLAESISTTKEKLETLKSVQEQVNEQLEKGDIGEKEYRDFQREIEATEQKLKSLTDEMKEFGSVSAQQIAAAGEKVKDVGSKIESTGKAFMPVTAAAVGLGTASIAAFKNLDEGYDTIVTATGAAGDALEGLKQSANDVYSSMNVSMGEVGGAIGEVNTRFGVTDDKLTGMTSTFLKFAEITGQDVVTAVANSDKIMEAWNIKTQDADKLLGLLAGKAQETGISVETLEQSLLRNGSTFKEMGLSVEQSIGLLAQFESKGIDSSTAIAGLRKAVQNATKDGLSADEAIKQSIESIKNASQETEALSIASELFGTKGAAEMTRAIREGRFNLDDLNTSMNDYQNTVSDTYEATQDPLDKMQVAFNSLKLAGSEMGKAILDVAYPTIEKLAGIVKSAAEKFQNMPEGMKQLIIVIGGLAAAIGPCLIIIGKLAESVGTIMTMVPQILNLISGIPNVISVIGSALSFIPTVLSTIGTALSGLWALMLANPITLIIAAVAALVAAFVILWNKCDAFREFWINLWDNISSFFSDIWNTISETAQKAWEAIVSFFTEGIPNFFEKVKEWFTQIPNNIGYALGLAIGKVAQWVIDMVDKAHEMGSNFIAKVIEFFTQLPTRISEFIKNALNHIITFAKEAPGKAKEMAANFLKNVTETLKTLPGKIGGFLKEAVSKAASWVKDMGNKGKEAITHMLSNIVDAAKSIPSKMIEIGKNIVQGVWNGIINAKNWFVGKVKDFFSGIVDGVKDALGISSPSKVFAKEVGKWIPAGVGKGITDNAQSALTPLQRLLDEVIGSVPDVSLTPKASGTSSPTASYSGVLNRILDKLDKLAATGVYLDGKKLVGWIIKDIDSGLSDISRQKARGM